MNKDCEGIYTLCLRHFHFDQLSASPRGKQVEIIFFENEIKASSLEGVPIGIGRGGCYVA